MRITLILAILLLGGTALRAEASIPGDMLYGMKVHVNENVRSLLSVSSRAEAAAEMENAIKRLEEAEKMIVSGLMTETARMNMERSFQTHMNLARNHIEHLREVGEFTATSDLELAIQNAMAAHRSIMLQISHNTNVELISLITKIENEQNMSAYKLENIQGRVLANADVQSAAHGKMIMASNAIDEARKLQLNQTGGLSSDVQIESRSSLAAAQSLFNQAKEEYDDGAYGNALILFQNSAHVARGAEILITNANILKLSKTGSKSAVKASIATELH